jgi:hydrogenase maturation protein HypF
MSQALQAIHIHIRGIVQGVGFRPFVYALALRYHINGWVLNNSSGVEITAEGSSEALAAFQSALMSELPPLAQIDNLDVHQIKPSGFDQFTIKHSEVQAGEFVPISPDVSICEDCLRELFDPADRRYRYPFINCTNCGPRFTIIKDIPYDRPKTTMAGFPLCPDCRQEYEDPLDRRFHAQPVACEVCGPQVYYVEQGVTIATGEDAIQHARNLLKTGKILAVKGLGGFHIACDAANQAAVATLRERKRRTDKPFALMAFSPKTVEKFVHLTQAEYDLLTSRKRPIVLLEKKESADTLSPLVAPKQTTLGFMLPYTPLHYLLLERQEGFPEVLVMTSGNLSEEPIAYHDQEAIQRLSPLVDGFLMHDRPIHMRVDDSVSRIVDGQEYLYRRARGYAPDPVLIPSDTPSILAAGGELKNVFGLSRDGYAFLSHHIGDVENYETIRSFQEGIDHFENLFRINPQLIACDSHPNYFTSQYARQLAKEEGLPLVEVQHHHAHLAACLADNQQYLTEENVIGCIFDGTGYGSDGTIWGGEFLIGNLAGFQRTYHLQAVPQPGGDLSTRTPSRMALAHLWQQGIPWDDLPPTKALTSQELSTLHNQLDKHVNTPLTSSMGRLFDAVSSLLDICQQVNYEAQAAIELETAIDPQAVGSYPFAIEEDQSAIGLLPFWHALVDDIHNHIPAATIATLFHNSLVDLQVLVCRRLHRQYNINTVVLSGGVWANHYLLTRTITALESEGFTVLRHRRVPCNDGGIALGQLMIAAQQWKENQKGT